MTAACAAAPLPPPPAPAARAKLLRCDSCPHRKYHTPKGLAMHILTSHSTLHLRAASDSETDPELQPAQKRQQEQHQPPSPSSSMSIAPTDDDDDFDVVSVTLEGGESPASVPAPVAAARARLVGVRKPRRDAASVCSGPAPRAAHPKLAVSLSALRAGARRAEAPRSRAAAAAHVELDFADAV